MKVSLSWLKDYVPVEMQVPELAHALTMTGLEVETVEDRYRWMASIITGRIDDILPHPDADRLKICIVDGGRRRYRVVCGAPNVRKEMCVPLALPGLKEAAYHPPPLWK